MWSTLIGQMTKAREEVTAAESIGPPDPPTAIPVLHRKGLITVADMSMYLGDSFDESKMEQYMRGVSSREDGLVSLSVTY